MKKKQFHFQPVDVKLWDRYIKSFNCDWHMVTQRACGRGGDQCKTASWISDHRFSASDGGSNEGLGHGKLLPPSAIRQKSTSKSREGCVHIQPPLSPPLTSQTFLVSSPLKSPWGPLRDAVDQRCSLEVH